KSGGPAPTWATRCRKEQPPRGCSAATARDWGCPSRTPSSRRTAGTSPPTATALVKGAFSRFASRPRWRYHCRLRSFPSLDDLPRPDGVFVSLRSSGVDNGSFFVMPSSNLHRHPDPHVLIVEDEQRLR